MQSRWSPTPSILPGRGDAQPVMPSCWTACCNAYFHQQVPFGGRSHCLYRNVSLQQPSCFSWAFPSLPHCLCSPPWSLGENQLSVLGWRELHILGVLSHPSMGAREVSRDLRLKFAVLGRSLPLLLVGSGLRSGIPKCLFFFSLLFSSKLVFLSSLVCVCIPYCVALFHIVSNVSNIFTLARAVMKFHMAVC